MLTGLLIDPILPVLIFNLAELAEEQAMLLLCCHSRWLLWSFDQNVVDHQSLQVQTSQLRSL